MITAATVNNRSDIQPITAILAVERIQAKYQARNKKKVLERVGELICQDLPDCNHKWVFEQFVAREKLGSTVMGHGIAIPHIRIAKIEYATAACITLLQPVDFNEPEKQCADLIFALAVPEQHDAEHLVLLKSIITLLHNEQIRQAIRHSDSPQAIYEILTASEHSHEQ